MKAAFRLLGPFVVFVGTFQLCLTKRADTEGQTRGITYVATGSVIFLLSAVLKDDRRNRF